MEEYKCPKCGEVMESFGQPQAQFVPKEQQDQLFPVEVICQVYHFYICKKCNIKMSSQESKKYIRTDITPDHADGL